ncbi:MAG: acyl-CoA-binding protein [Flavobacterium sp.]|jgi:diazepam-binding inhibitor (GABA receptor modulating acyl-CoA-binding protein)
MKSELEIKFLKAFEIASQMQEQLPPDVMLKFYAYYKQGQDDLSNNRNIANNDLRNAFKMNALMQISHLSKDEAKTEYIKLVEDYTNQKI